MRKSRIFDLKRLHISRSIRLNGWWLLLLAILVTGLVCGTVFSTKSPVTEQSATRYFARFSLIRTNAKFFALSCRLFLSSLLLLLVFFLSGTSVLGLVLSPIFLGFCAFHFGALGAFLYATYGIKGVALYAVLMVPPAVPAVICFLLAALFSVRLATVLSKLTFPNSSPAYLYPAFKDYCKKFLLLSLLLLISAILDAALSVSFFGSFLSGF